MSQAAACQDNLQCGQQARTKDALGVCYLSTSTAVGGTHSSLEGINLTQLSDKAGSKAQGSHNLIFSLEATD